MLGKIISAIIGSFLWGIGANIIIGVAFGTYGALAFSVVALCAMGLLLYQGLRVGKGSIDIWVFIFRGLGVEALLFPIANMIMGLTTPHTLPGGDLKVLLIYSGFIGVLLGITFFFNARLLNTRIKVMQVRINQKNAGGRERGRS